MVSHAPSLPVLATTAEEKVDASSGADEQVRKPGDDKLGGSNHSKGRRSKVLADVPVHSSGRRGEHERQGCPRDDAIEAWGHAHLLQQHGPGRKDRYTPPPYHTLLNARQNLHPTYE